MRWILSLLSVKSAVTWLLIVTRESWIHFEQRMLGILPQEKLTNDKKETCRRLMLLSFVVWVYFQSPWVVGKISSGQNHRSGSCPLSVSPQLQTVQSLTQKHHVTVPWLTHLQNRDPVTDFWASILIYSMYNLIPAYFVQWLFFFLLITGLNQRGVLKTRLSFLRFFFFTRWKEWSEMDW